MATQVTVLDGDRASVDAIASEPLAGAVEIGAKVSVEVDSKTLTAPVRAGQTIGTARLVSNGKTIASCPLSAATAVDAWSLSAAIRNVLRSWALQFS